MIVNVAVELDYRCVE